MSLIDYEAIKRAKDAVKIPIVANGDISEKNAIDVFNITGCDGIMVGRASIGKPWIFHEIKTADKVSDELKKEIILAHFDAMIAHYGPHGTTIFRKHLHQYSKGINGASGFREEINKINDTETMRGKIEDFFKF